MLTQPLPDTFARPAHVLVIDEVAHIVSDLVNVTFFMRGGDISERGNVAQGPQSIEGDLKSMSPQGLSKPPGMMPGYYKI